MKILLTIAALLVLAVPAASAAPPTGNTQNAAKTCKAERGASAQSMEAFNQRHGKNANKKNAFGKCVSKHSKFG